MSDVPDIKGFIGWADPPETVRGNRGKTVVDWRTLAGFLMAQPGRWAEVEPVRGSPTYLRRLGLEYAARGGRLFVRFPEG